MKRIYIKARAKVNLCLNVLNKRPDGYHNLETVFQKISLYDELYIERTNTNNIELFCNIKELETKSNIIVKAYTKLKEQNPSISGIKITLIKNIPSEAGLAGGSTDCASFLIAMNKLFNLKYSMKDLINIGKTLGADVPSCLQKNALLATGIGEIITPINTSLKYYIVIIKPKISLSTKLMYEKLDCKNNIIQKYNSKKIVKALETNNFEMLKENLYNVFEETIEDISEIENLKEILIQNGAKSSILTGSGSCVFGLFSNKEEAKMAYYSLKKLYNTFFCVAYNKEVQESVV